MTLDPSTALGHLPKTLRDELVEEFGKITRNYRERRWEAAELDGGRFCEIVFTILAGHLDGDAYPAKASKPSRFRDACDALGQKPRSYSDSARLIIPRTLVGLYDVRNRRGVGHVGGEVNANHMDATFVLHTTQWVMAELVRMFHSTDIKAATTVVDALVDRTVPLLWEVGGVTRILDPAMSLADGTLLLLHASPQGLTDTSLAESLEQERLSNYKRVLTRLHQSRQIEYNRKSGLAVISPLGVQEVEERILTST